MVFVFYNQLKWSERTATTSRHFWHLSDTRGCSDEVGGSPPITRGSQPYNPVIVAVRCMPKVTYHTLLATEVGLGKVPSLVSATVLRLSLESPCSSALFLRQSSSINQLCPAFSICSHLNYSLHERCCPSRSSSFGRLKCREAAAKLKWPTSPTSTTSFVPNSTIGMLLSTLFYSFCLLSQPFHPLLWPVSFVRISSFPKAMLKCVVFPWLVLSSLRVLSYFELRCYEDDVLLRLCPPFNECLVRLGRALTACVAAVVSHTYFLCPQYNGMEVICFPQSNLH